MRRYCLQRPNNFTIDSTHYLARGLVFAGLAPGGMVGSTRYHDSSLHGNHGTLTAMDPSTDWVFDPTLGRFRLDFDHNDDYTTLPTTTIGSGSSLSVSCWVNIVTDAAQFVIARVSRIVSAYNWGLYYSATTKTFGFYVVTTGTVAPFDTVAIGLNAWHHLVGTYDGKYVRIYRNGVLAGSLEQTGTFSNTNELQVGAEWKYDHFGGKISDPLIYNRALSPAEISKLADPSNVLLSGLILPPKRQIFAAYTSTTPTTDYKVYRKMNYYRKLRSF